MRFWEIRIIWCLQLTITVMPIIHTLLDQTVCSTKARNVIHLLQVLWIPVTSEFSQNKHLSTNRHFFLASIWYSRGCCFIQLASKHHEFERLQMLAQCYKISASISQKAGCSPEVEHGGIKICGKQLIKLAVGYCVYLCTLARLYIWILSWHKLN